MINGIWALVSVLVSFILTALLGKKLIPFLHKLKFGQTILEIGPNWHKSKQGTPTMGGLMFIIGTGLTSTIAFLIYRYRFVNLYTDESSLQKQQVFIFAGLVMAIFYGLVGFIDDYTKVVRKRNLGITPIQKLVLQFLIAASYLTVLSINGYTTSTRIPFVGDVDLGFFYYILSCIVIVGFVNAVNLTDGIDGLVGSLTFFVAIFLMLTANFLQYVGLVIVSAALVGGCLGFLVWNFHPAKVFMGDTGSLFLGGILCAIVFALGFPVLLLPFGLVYIIEMASVMLQVTYFKISGGKRLFKMSPIHHHFEMSGWSEVKIVSVFSFLAAVFSLAAFLCVYFG